MFDALVIFTRRSAVRAARRTSPCRDDTTQSGIIGTPLPGFQLLANSGNLGRESRYRTRDGPTCNGSIFHVRILFRLKYLKQGLANLDNLSICKSLFDNLDFDLAIRVSNPSQRLLVATLLGEPQRTKHWHFNRNLALARRFGKDRASPNESNGVLVLGGLVEFPDCLDKPLSGNIAPLSKFFGEFVLITGDELKNDFVQQHWQWIEVRREDICPDSNTFQRYGTTACKRIDDHRNGTTLRTNRLVGRLCECSTGFEVVGHGRVVPVGEVGDEVQQGEPQHVLMGFVGWVEGDARFGDCLPTGETLLGAGIRELLRRGGLGGKR